MLDHLRAQTCFGDGPNTMSRIAPKLISEAGHYCFVIALWHLCKPVRDHSILMSGNFFFLNFDLPPMDTFWTSLNETGTPVQFPQPPGPPSHLENCPSTLILGELLHVCAALKDSSSKHTHLLLNGASVDLDFHDMCFLLSKIKFHDLSVSNQSNNGRILFEAFLPLVVIILNVIRGVLLESCRGLVFRAVPANN